RAQDRGRRPLDLFGELPLQILEAQGDMQPCVDRAKDLALAHRFDEPGRVVDQLLSLPDGGRHQEEAEADRDCEPQSITVRMASERLKPRRCSILTGCSSVIAMSSAAPASPTATRDLASIATTAATRRTPNATVNTVLSVTCEG